MPAQITPDDFGGARVKPEADQYYRRNQGTMGQFFDQQVNKSYSSPRPNPRCPSSAAKEQYEKHRGQLGNWLDQSKNRNYASPRPNPRCPTPAAQEQYEKHKGCMSDLMTGYPSMANKPVIHPRTVKPEAGHIAEAHKGTGTKKLFESYGRMPLSARGAPRVKPEAEGNFEKNKGYTVKLFQEYGRLPRSARPVPKVKPEAEGNAELDRGGRASKILSMAPPSNRMQSSCVF